MLKTPIESNIWKFSSSITAKYLLWLIAIPHVDVVGRWSGDASKLLASLIVIEKDVVTEETDGATESTTESIRALHLKKAIPLVKKTFDVVLLSKWLEEEDRPGVSTAITKQIEMVEEKAKEKDDKQN